MLKNNKMKDTDSRFKQMGDELIDEDLDFISGGTIPAKYWNQLSTAVKKKYQMLSLYEVQYGGGKSACVCCDEYGEFIPPEITGV